MRPGGCLGFSQLNLIRPDGTVASLFGYPPDGLVLWQGGGLPGDPNCSQAVPARGRTWGAIKLLYR